MGVVGILFVVAAYVAFSLFVRRGVTSVPGVVGMTLAESRETLSDHGLVVEHDEEGDRYSDEVPAGKVLEQQPRSGTLVKRGGRVELVLSKGEHRVTVPALDGDALPAVQVTLAGRGLSIGETAQIFSGAQPLGTVVAQDPAAGVEVAPGTAVKLFLASGRGEAYVMPDLIEESYRLVRRLFERSEFRLGSVRFEPYEGIDRAIVLRQFPLPGHPVRRGDVISLVVAATEEQQRRGPT